MPSDVFALSARKSMAQIQSPTVRRNRLWRRKFSLTFPIVLNSARMIMLRRTRQSTMRRRRRM
eukprot:1957000-Rhodomonas_salina.1